MAGRQLETVYEDASPEIQEKAPKLAESVEVAREEMVGAVEQLEEVLAPEEPADGMTSRTIDIWFDGSWGGFRGWTSSVLDLMPSRVPDYSSFETLNALLFGMRPIIDRGYPSRTSDASDL